MSGVIPLPLKRVAEREQISPTCLLSFLTLLYHERFYCSPYFSWWKIIHLFQLGVKIDFFLLLLLFCQSMLLCPIYRLMDDEDKVKGGVQSYRYIMKHTVILYGLDMTQHVFIFLLL